MKRQATWLLAVALGFASANAVGEQSRSAVGYCAGPPCCRYEGSACSDSDNAVLIYRSKIAEGQQAFCSKLMTSRWSYIPLNVEHTVSQEEIQTYLSGVRAIPSIAPKAGHFDIDNDGRPEYVGWVQMYSGGGSGCDIEIFVELDEQRAHIKRSKLSALLTENSCRDYHRAFRFNGKTYIENRRIADAPYLNFSLPSVLTEVFIVEGGSKRSVCKYHLNE